MRPNKNFVHAITTIVFFVLLGIVYFVTQEHNIGVSLGDVLYKDEHAGHVADGSDLFFPEKNPFIYKALPFTPKPTATPSVTPSISVTVTPSVSVTTSVSVTPTPTEDAGTTVTPTPTVIQTATPTPMPTATNTPTPTPTQNN